MTTDEAKDYIREWCPYGKQDEIIKALSNSDEDCISRADAINALDYYISITSDEGLDEYRTVLKEMLGKIYYTQKAQIEALPSIQPKAKEWHENQVDKGRLEHIKNYIVDNIMRDPDIMFSDDCRNKVDLPSVIASLYECLYIKVMGEPYGYMFHWANKCGSWVEDDLFIDRK